MVRIDAMGLRVMQPVRRSRHAKFRVDHVLRRIARIGHFACLGIDALRLKFLTPVMP